MKERCSDGICVIVWENVAARFSAIPVAPAGNLQITVLPMGHIIPMGHTILLNLLTAILNPLLQAGIGKAQAKFALVLPPRTREGRSFAF
jgi:hypothetical protein